MKYKKKTLLEIIGFLITACLLMAKFSMSMPIYTSTNELTIMVDSTDTTTDTLTSPKPNSTNTSSTDLNNDKESSDEWNTKSLQNISKVFEVIGCLLMVALIISICLFWIYNLIETENNSNTNNTDSSISPTYLHLPYNLAGVPPPPAYTIYYPE